MSFGGGGGGPQESTVTQTTLPDYAEPYVTRLFERTEAESKRAYTPYGAPRIAGPSPNTQAGRQFAASIGPGIAGLDQAQQATAGTMTQAQELGSQGIGGIYSQANFSAPGTYLGDTTTQYMSPYMQNVVDVQKDRAQLDFDRMQAGRDAQAVQAGAFGGSRSAVVDALAQEDLARRMGEIQAQGQQAAFEQGAQMFEQDRAARMGTEQAIAQDLARVQSGQMSQEQFNRQLSERGIAMTADLANQLASLGGAERQAAMEQQGLLREIGAEETAEQQALLSQDYQDFLRQQNYQKEQLKFYSDILRGNIRQSDMATIDYTQTNPYSQMLGAGISALGLSQGMS